jgi:hypothetical protein
MNLEFQTAKLRNYAQKANQTIEFFSENNQFLAQFIGLWQELPKNII